MGEKKVDRFLFKLSDKLGEGSYGQVISETICRSLKDMMKKIKRLLQ